MPDYLIDARVQKVSFMKVKSFLKERGAPPLEADLFDTFN